jgi:hypothetical protein
VRAYLNTQYHLADADYRFYHPAWDFIDGHAGSAWITAEPGWIAEFSYVTQLRVAITPFRCKELDRCTFTADDVNDAPSNLTYAGVRHITNSVEGQLLDPVDPDNPLDPTPDPPGGAVTREFFYVRRLKKWMWYEHTETIVNGGEIKLALLGYYKNAAGTGYEPRVLGGGNYAFDAQGQSETREGDVQGFVKAYLNAKNDDDLYCFAYFIAPGGIDLPADNPTSLENSLLNLRAATTSGGFDEDQAQLGDPAPIMLGTASVRRLEWSSSSFTGGRVHFKSGQPLTYRISRVPPSLVKSLDT